MRSLNEQLFAAIESGNVDEVAALLKNGASVNAKDSHDRIAIDGSMRVFCSSSSTCVAHILQYAASMIFSDLHQPKCTLSTLMGHLFTALSNIWQLAIYNML